MNITIKDLLKPENQQIQNELIKHMRAHQPIINSFNWSGNQLDLNAPLILRYSKKRKFVYEVIGKSLEEQGGQATVFINAGFLHIQNNALQFIDKQNRIIKKYKLNQTDVQKKDVQKKYIENEYNNANEKSHLRTRLIYSDKNAYSIMKKINGKNLWNVLNEYDSKIPPAIILALFSNILRKYKEQVSDKDVFHRDIKLENIMADIKAESIDVNIIDYGTSVSDKDKLSYTDIVGTPVYMAPEIWGRKPYNKSADIYGIGYVLAELLGYEIYESDSNEESKQKESDDGYKEGKIKTLTQLQLFGHPTNDELAQFIITLLKSDPNSRIKNIDEALDSLDAIIKKYCETHPNEKQDIARYCPSLFIASGKAKETHKDLQEESVDLYELPTCNRILTENNQYTVTLGDLHGNSMYLLFFLIKEGVLSGITSDDYKSLVNFYKKSWTQLIENDLDKFNAILNKAQCNANITVRLIGDELADRGSNDYFTLKILKKLSINKTPLEILFSNHSMEFMSNYEKPTVNYSKEFVIIKRQTTSMHNLGSLIEKGLVKKEEIDSIIDNYYTRYLKAIAYDLNESDKKLIIYTHAPVGLDGIEGLAQNCGVFYDEGSLTTTIDKINKHFFQQYVNSKKINTIEVLKDYETAALAIKKSPFFHLAWNKDVDSITRPHKHKEYSLYFVHGHTETANDQSHIINLDGILGKSPNHHKGFYKTFKFNHPLVNGASLAQKQFFPNAKSIKNQSNQNHTNYKFSQSGYESDYESEGGTHYYPKKTLGEGTYSKARKFQSRDGKKEKAVIAPKNTNDIYFNEVEAKYHFFKAIYPDKEVKLVKERGTYRLVAPLIPGDAYDKLTIISKEQQIKFFLSAVKALKNCHNQGYIVIDLKEDNIHYDKITGESYLIDGGLAVKKNGFVSPDVFKQANEIEVQKNRAQYYYIAPECWSTKEVIADETMDIYSLGNMMARIIGKAPHPSLVRITQLCQDRIITNRPSLSTLEDWLNGLLIISNTVNRITAVTVDFGKQSTLKNVEMHKDHLLKMMNNLVTSRELGSAYSTLGMTGHDNEIENAFRQKKQEIDFHAVIAVVQAIHQIQVNFNPTQDINIQYQGFMDHLNGAVKGTDQNNQQITNAVQQKRQEINDQASIAQVVQAIHQIQVNFNPTQDINIQYQGFMDHLNGAVPGPFQDNQQIANAVQKKQDEIKQIYKRAQQQQQAEAQQKNQAQALIDGHVQQIRHLEVSFTNITTVAEVNQHNTALHRQLNEYIASRKNEISNALATLNINEDLSLIAQAIADKIQDIDVQAQQIVKRINEELRQRQAEAQQKNQAQALIDGHVQQIRHLEVSFTNITTVAEEQEAIAVHEINGPMELNVSSPLSNISMMVLGGFIAAAGIAAVALSFTLLNALTLGMPGLIVGSIGVAAALSGIGLFATGAYKNRTIISENTLNFSDELAVQ
jgi:serine/threonine protein kinase